MFKKCLKGTIAENWWQDEMVWDEFDDDIGLGDEINDTSSNSSTSVSLTSSAISSRRGSIDVDPAELPDLRISLQKLLRERLQSQAQSPSSSSLSLLSCASSGYNSLSTSFY